MSEGVDASFACFGGEVRLHVLGDDPTGATASEAIALAEARLLDVHRRLSRFIDDSELSRLNRDRRETVPASALMRRFAAAVIVAGHRSRGLVDATRLGHLERAGYRQSLGDKEPIPLVGALAAAPPRKPARAHAAGAWRTIRFDDATETVSRPPGLRLDSGGVAKGMAADLVAALLRGHEAFAVDCAGDIRIGGRWALPRPVQVQSPFDESVIHRFELSSGGVATSGIGRRSWLDRTGAPAHHLLDPSSGAPAYTGVVQTTAVAPTAALAEVYAKAALLSGPERAAGWLPHGGVIVDDRNEMRVVESEMAMHPATAGVGAVS